MSKQHHDQADAALVSRWFDAFGPALLLYARQFVADADAEDLVQEVFLRAMDRRESLADPRSWLFRVLRNATISRHRAGSRRARRERRSSSDKPRWFEPSPTGQLDVREVETRLRGLDIVAREVVVLRTWGELTFEQIGDVVGCSAATALRRYRAGLEELRQALNADAGDSAVGPPARGEKVRKEPIDARPRA